MSDIYRIGIKNFLYFLRLYFSLLTPFYWLIKCKEFKNICFLGSHYRSRSTML